MIRGPRSQAVFQDSFPVYFGVNLHLFRHENERSTSRSGNPCPDHYRSRPLTPSGLKNIRLGRGSLPAPAPVILLVYELLHGKQLFVRKHDVLVSSICETSFQFFCSLKSYDPLLVGKFLNMLDLVRTCLQLGFKYFTDTHMRYSKVKGQFSRTPSRISQNSVSHLSYIR